MILLRSSMYPGSLQWSCSSDLTGQKVPFCVGFPAFNKSWRCWVEPDRWQPLGAPHCDSLIVIVYNRHLRPEQHVLGT